MIKTVYRRALSTLLNLPLRLWAISLLYMLLYALSGTLAVVPVLAMAVQLLLHLGMVALYLRGIRGEAVSCEQLFDGFRGNFWRKLGGVAWMFLWLFLWCLIPVVGIVMYIIKGYAYRFAFFILMTRPEVSATDALKLAREESKGVKGAMFGADVLLGLAAAVGILLLALLAQLPVIGFLFGILLVIFAVFCVAFLPLLYGLVGAAFYDEVSARHAAQAYEAAPAYGAPPVYETAPAYGAPPAAPVFVPVPAPAEAPAAEELPPVPELELPDGPAVPEFEPVAPELPVPEAPQPPVEAAAPEERRCPVCGSAVGASARFCRECGSPMQDG